MQDLFSECLAQRQLAAQLRERLCEVKQQQQQQHETNEAQAAAAAAARAALASPQRKPPPSPSPSAATAPTAAALAEAAVAATATATAAAAAAAGVTRLEAELRAAQGAAAEAEERHTAHVELQHQSIARLQVEARVLRACVAQGDTERAAQGGGAEQARHGVQLQAARDELASARRMLQAQQAAAGQALEEERRLRTLLAEQQQLALRLRREAQDAASGTEGGGAGGGGGGGGGGLRGAETPRAADASAAVVEGVLAARAADEVSGLRAQLHAAHSKAALLQEQVVGAEAELGELHDAYTLVCDELQEQRLAMSTAMAQCQSLRRQLDSHSGTG